MSIAQKGKLFITIFYSAHELGDTILRAILSGIFLIFWEQNTS
ncbi:hypothetical protein THOE12_120088 [Vibrio rotiferianus]|nr:hypothetical protein THOE12_120088 [Vibrio rotiferianus]